MNDLLYFKKGFEKHASIGDTIQAEAEGFTIIATIKEDSIMSPETYDEGFWPSTDPKSPGYCLPEIYEEQMVKAKKIKEAWRNDEWFYCGLVLSVFKKFKIPFYPEQTIVFAHAASVWGLECNHPYGDNTVDLTQAAENLVEEALNYAKEAIRQLVQSRTKTEKEEDL